MIKKNYLGNPFASRFQNVENPYKTNGNTVSQNAKTHRENPYKTLLKLIISSHFRKRGSKSIKKHHLERISASRFQNVGKPYKPNGIQRFHNTLFGPQGPSAGSDETFIRSDETFIDETFIDETSINEGFIEPDETFIDETFIDEGNVRHNLNCIVTI